TPTALRFVRIGVQGGQRNALATGRSIGANRNRRPEKRRPPYGSCASACRVVNATRWPPGGASVQTAIGGRKNADRPTNPRHQRAQWAPMTDFHPACCAPLREHWPLPLPMPGATLVSTLFQADRLQPGDFVACAIPAVPGASKRQCEYLAGRLCARHALHRLTGQADVPAVGEDRAPHWPAGVVASITHGQGQAAALVASTGQWRGVGIDLERLLSAERSQRLCGEILTPGERERLADVDTALHPWLISLTFSAKESLFKAL